MICELEHKIFTIEDTGFDRLALVIFHYQYERNLVYREFVNQLGIDRFGITKASDIPFLPIDFFKTHTIATGSFQPEAVFESSGTTDTIPSRHFVKDISVYRESIVKGFNRNYDSIHDWCILGLLPSYLERKNSSLVLMVREFMEIGKHPLSGFYLYNYNELFHVLRNLEASQQKTLLFGVTFALLDFAEACPHPLKHTVVMETGGMKGRKEEMIRDEVHDILKNAWSLSAIHSEYGMTELLSQAYSFGNGIFECPPWMRVLTREEDDPFGIKKKGRGLLNIIDLANLYSCSFIATDDIGYVYPDGKFEVLGRRDYSDLRGCSLMAAGL
jgi:hypothetical protein